MRPRCHPPVPRRLTERPPRRPCSPIDERLAALEAAVLELRDRPAPESAPSPATGTLLDGIDVLRRAADPAAQAERIRSQQSRILVPAGDAAQKLDAWRQLRGEPDSYDDAVVAEMVRLGLSAEDADVRADVWRQADGQSRHDARVPALLQALQTDRIDEVREEAADTLAIYAD